MLLQFLLSVIPFSFYAISYPQIFNGGCFTAAIKNKSTRERLRN
jgi:hypothetical protein